MNIISTPIYYYYYYYNKKNYYYYLPLLCMIIISGKKYPVNILLHRRLSNSVYTCIKYTFQKQSIENIDASFDIHIKIILSKLVERGREK